MFKRISVIFNEQTAILNKIGNEAVDIGLISEFTNIDPFPKLNSYDRKTFVELTEVFNFAIKQYNILVNEIRFVDDFGDVAQSIRPIALQSLVISDVNKSVLNILETLEKRIKFVSENAIGMGIVLPNTSPEPPVTPPKEPEEPEVKPPVKPEEPNLKPFPTQVINRGWKRVKEFPEREWPGIQGTAIDDEWYYTFGMRSNSDTKLRLIVSNRRDDSQSFIAVGDIGSYTSWQDNPVDNPLGHTNGATVLQREGDEVTLLIASMHGGQVVTAIVDLKKKTVRTGKITYLYGSAGERIGAVTSVQKMADGKILFKASAYYWWGTFREDRIILTKAFKWNNATALELIQKLFGQDFVKSVAGQSDWFEDGYLYSISWSDNWEKCFVFELIPNGPNDTAIWSNRMWWDEVKGRRFEPESIWFEGNQLKSGVSMNRPYEAFIAELNFKK